MARSAFAGQPAGSVGTMRHPHMRKRGARRILERTGIIVTGNKTQISLIYVPVNLLLHKTPAITRTYAYHSGREHLSKFADNDGDD